MKLAQSPEGREFVERRAATQIKSGVEEALAGSFNGPRPVRLDIQVASLDIPTTFSRLWSDRKDTLVAEAALIDKAGQTIATLPSGSVQEGFRSGLLVRGNRDRAQVLGLEFGDRVKQWLAQN